MLNYQRVMILGNNLGLFRKIGPAMLDCLEPEKHSWRIANFRRHTWQWRRQDSKKLPLFYELQRTTTFSCLNYRIYIYILYTYIHTYIHTDYDEPPCPTITFKRPCAAHWDRCHGHTEHCRHAAGTWVDWFFRIMKCITIGSMVLVY